MLLNFERRQGRFHIYHPVAGALGEDWHSWLVVHRRGRYHTIWWSWRYWRHWSSHGAIVHDRRKLLYRHRGLLRILEMPRLYRARPLPLQFLLLGNQSSIGGHPLSSGTLFLFKMCQFTPPLDLSAYKEQA